MPRSGPGGHTSETQMLEHREVIVMENLRFLGARGVPLAEAAARLAACSWGPAFSPSALEKWLQRRGEYDLLAQMRVPPMPRDAKT